MSPNRGNEAFVTKYIQRVPASIRAQIFKG